jgi:hypothetical protein
MKKQGQPEPKLKWLDGTLRQFTFLTVLRERNQVRRTCIDTLKLYREVAAELPQADSHQRYERVVARRTGADAAGVATILRRAKESFASWPYDRPLMFRHVAQYLAITERLNADPEVGGVCTRVDAVVARFIPADL